MIACRFLSRELRSGCRDAVYRPSDTIRQPSAAGCGLDSGHESECKLNHEKRDRYARLTALSAPPVCGEGKKPAAPACHQALWWGAIDHRWFSIDRVFGSIDHRSCSIDHELHSIDHVSHSIGQATNFDPQKPLISRAAGDPSPSAQKTASRSAIRQSRGGFSRFISFSQGT